MTFTKSDFERLNVDDLIADAEKKDCHSYSSLFLRKAREAEESNDSTAQEVFRFLGDITSMMLKPESRTDPFLPLAVMDGKRSAIIDDFEDADLQTLREIAESIKDPELRSRITDVLWLKRHDFRMAELSVASYL